MPHEFAGTDIGRFAIGHGNLAVNNDVVEAFAELVRVFEGCFVLYLAWIEQHKVRDEPGPNDATVQLAGGTDEWAEEVLLMKEISGTRPARACAAVCRRAIDCTRLTVMARADEMLRAERALSLKLSHKLQDATDMDQEAVEQDLRMSQSLLDTVNVLNEQVMALQDQEQSEVRMLQEMLSDAKTQLEQHAWEKKRMQDEVQWLRSQLSSAFAAGDASVEHLRTRSNVSLDSDAPDEGVARDVTAPRTSVQSLQRERDIGVQSLTAALGKMMTERLRS